MTDKEINRLIATQLLDWGYAQNSDTYWLEIGVQIGDASSFNPLSDRYQGEMVISTLELPCTFETLKDYVLSLSETERRAIGRKYGAIQREEAGIKYYVQPTLS